jgi:hypothetical protein
MRKFFASNIDRKGRIFRLILGLALIVASLFVFNTTWLGGAGLVGAGVFGLYEAARGWCLMRACSDEAVSLPKDRGGTNSTHYA